MGTIREKGTKCLGKKLETSLSPPREGGAIGTGGRQAEVIEASLCRLIDIAGYGDASDRARFRNYAAPRTPMTNAIGVAETSLV